MAKEPPVGRFTDWLNLRVQRPKGTATGGRMRGGKRATGKKEKSESQDAQTFQVSQQIHAIADARFARENSLVKFVIEVYF